MVLPVADGSSTDLHAQRCGQRGQRKGDELWSKGSWGEPKEEATAEAWSTKHANLTVHGDAPAMCTVMHEL